MHSGQRAQTVTTKYTYQTKRGHTPRPPLHSSCSALAVATVLFSLSRSPHFHPIYPPSSFSAVAGPTRNSQVTRYLDLVSSSLHYWRRLPLYFHATLCYPTTRMPRHQGRRGLDPH